MKRYKNITVTENPNNDRTEFENKYGQIKVEFEEDADTGLQVMKSATLMNDTSDGNTPTLKNLEIWKNNLKKYESSAPENLKEALIDRSNQQVAHIENMDSYAEYKAYYEYFENLSSKFNEYMLIYYQSLPISALDEEYIKYSNYLNSINQISSCFKTQNNMYKEFLEEAYKTDMYYSESDKKYRAAINGLQKYHSALGGVESGAKESANCLKDVINQLDTINDRVETCAKTIDNLEDDAAKSQMQSDINTLAETVNIDDVQKLKLILDNIGKDFEKLRKDSEKVKYWKKPVHTLYSGNFADFMISHNEDFEFTKNCNSFKDAKDAFKQPNLDYDSIVKNEVVSKDVKKYVRLITGKSDDEKFFNVLLNNYGEKKSEESTKESNELEKIENASDGIQNGETKDINIEYKDGVEEATEPQKPSGNYGGDISVFNSAVQDIGNGETMKYENVDNISVPDSNSLNTGDAKQDSENANNAADDGMDQFNKAKTLLDNIANLADKLKDDIYLEEYFTEMFTCQTDKLKKTGELVLLNGYSNSLNSAKYINDKNAWYGQEIEYILWGNPTIDENVKQTETMIFLIRFAVNAIYAFTASDIQTMINPIATALVCGILPLVPVVQAVITLALALAESAIDLQMLKNGKDVPLIKDSATFICSPSGARNKLAEEAIDITTQYVEDKVSTGIDKLAEEAKKGGAGVTEKLNEVVQGYIDQQTNSIKTAVKDNFTNPLINCIQPILSQIDADKSNSESVVREKIEQAWKIIGESTDNITNQTVKKAAKGILSNDSIKEGLIKEINTKINDNIPSADIIKKVINEKIDGAINSVKNIIDDKVDEAAKEFRSALEKKINDGADNLKEFANQKLEETGENIKNNVSQKLSQEVTKNISKGSKSKSIAAKVTMNYKEYCKLFMFIGLVIGNQDDEMLKRAAALMQANVNYAVKVENGNVVNIKSENQRNFQMTSSYTMFYVKADLKMNTLFPWAVKVETTETDTNANFDLSKLGGNSVRVSYSGIAGY